jgi:hypothetical protein
MTGRIFPFLQEVVSHVDEAAAKCEKVVVGGRDVSELYSEIAWSLEVAYDSKSSIDDSNRIDDTDDPSDASSTSKRTSFRLKLGRHFAVSCQIRSIFRRSLWLGFVSARRHYHFTEASKRYICAVPEICCE